MDALKSFLIEGVRLIRLTGTDLERATQHGDEIRKLTKEGRDTLALHPLSKKNQSLLERAVRSNPSIPDFTKNTAVKALLKTYEETVLRHHRQLEDRYRVRLEAFARHSRLSPRELIFALYQPDFLMVLAALTSERVSPHFLSGMPGCSSAVVRTGPDGGITLLRNLDYPAAGHWEKWSTVFFHEPAETHYQKFISVGSLGIHLAGLSGVNESGIGFSLHAHFSKKFSLRGVPIFFLGQEIMESARTIDEAVQLCKSFKTIGSWAINLASDRENRAITIELSDGQTFVREMSPDDPAHAHSNGFQYSEFQKQELHFSGSFLEDVESRKCSLEKDLTVPLEQILSLQQALGALASHRDHETGETRIFGNSVSVVTTIQSLAIDLRNQKIHLSTRRETPTPLGPYLSIPTEWNQIAVTATQPSVTHLNSDFTPAFLEALRHYHFAYISWHVMSETPSQTLEHLIHATDALQSNQQNDPHLWMQRGYFELLLARTDGHFENALNCFRTALKEKISLHHQQVARYFESACLDLLGQHRAAMDTYQMLADAIDVDPKLKKRAIKRLKKPYRPVDCLRLVPDLQFVEPLEYA
jgi:predicted choloylglycine hydrolase